MNDRRRRPAPTVEVIRKPNPPDQGQAAVRPTPRASPQRASAASSSRGRGPRAPPSSEQVEALAQRAHVPLRIARGELLGKMTTRVWRKLHPEAASRFDQAYELKAKNPQMTIEDAFGVLESGMTTDQLLARRKNAEQRKTIRQARGEVKGDAVAAHLSRLISEQREVAVVLGDSVSFDVLASDHPTQLELRQKGRTPKLQVVLIAGRDVWEELSKLDRDPALAARPKPVPIEPEKRPFSDPRPFLQAVGKPIDVLLRNGLAFTMNLLAVGPFDLLVGQEGRAVFLPLHALLRAEVKG